MSSFVAFLKVAYFNKLSLLSIMTCQSADIMGSLCGVCVHIHVDNFSAKIKGGYKGCQKGYSDFMVTLKSQYQWS